MQLTKNFMLSEFYTSETAKQMKINNLPPIECVVNITRLADNVMQKIRDHFKMPVAISSGYRCVSLNSILGGASTSQHIKGMAADFTVKGYTIKQVFDWCKENLIYDQLINEKNQWVHISFNIFENRKEALFYDGGTYIKL